MRMHAYVCTRRAVPTPYNAPGPRSRRTIPRIRDVETVCCTFHLEGCIACCTCTHIDTETRRTPCTREAVRYTGYGTQACTLTPPALRPIPHLDGMDAQGCSPYTQDTRVRAPRVCRRRLVRYIQSARVWPIWPAGLTGLQNVYAPCIPSMAYGYLVVLISLRRCGTGYGCMVYKVRKTSISNLSRERRIGIYVFGVRALDPLIPFSMQRTS